jgi:hypothetical protein
VGTQDPEVKTDFHIPEWGQQDVTVKAVVKSEFDTDIN